MPYPASRLYTPPAATGKGNFNLQFEPRDQFEQRQKKLEQIQALGFEAFPREFRWSHTAADLVRLYESAQSADLEADKKEVRVAGRIVSYRLMGKAGFAHLQGGGKRIQIYVRKDVVGERGFQLFHLLDLGDHVGVRGHMFRTKTGELSVWVEELFFLSKALLPLPEKWHGLADIELRYRMRYLDLIATERSREIFETRARIVRELRKFFDARGYIEVETPMMHPIAGGAAARPFVTHHNTLDIDLYLRIAPELYLKRLTVGGFDRVYEINRNFRNEGISTQHNPEFTMLEFYEAYSNYRDLMDLNEQLFAQIAQAITGSTTVKYGEVELDFSKMQRLTMREAIVKYWPEGAGAAPTLEELAAPGGAQRATERYNAWAKANHAPYAAAKGKLADGEWTGLLFETIAEDKLIQPTILYDFPDGDFTALQAEAGGSEPDRAIRNLRGRDGDRQRLFGIKRSRRAGAALPGADRAGRRRSPQATRRGLRPRPGARHAANRRRRHRHRPPDDASDGFAFHPRRHFVPPPPPEGNSEEEPPAQAAGKA